MNPILRSLFPITCVVLVVAAAACSSDDTKGDAGPAAASCAAPGGAVSGAADTHCSGQPAQPTDLASCHVDVVALTKQARPRPAVASDAAADSSADATTGDAGGADADAGDDQGSSYGPTMYGSEGDDDDCKYHVKWTSTPLCEDGSVTFTVTATKKADGSPLTGAAPYAEVYLDSTHLGGSDEQNFQETSPGVYTIGPITFDKPGQWTTRFHFYGDCDDLVPTSPHGHAAFFMQLP